MDYVAENNLGDRVHLIHDLPHKASPWQFISRPLYLYTLRVSKGSEYLIIEAMHSQLPVIAATGIA